MEIIPRLSALLPLAIVAYLVLARHRLGALHAASWLVVVGAVVMVGEHPQFAITYAASLAWPEASQLVLIPHARLHFFMAGIYAMVGAGLLCVIACTLLRDGRRIGWYTVLIAVIVGGVFDLVFGGLWFQHGSPLYGLLGGDASGFGWEFLYTYLLAWSAALAISYRPIFGKQPAIAHVENVRSVD